MLLKIDSTSRNAPQSLTEAELKFQRSYISKEKYLNYNLFGFEQVRTTNYDLLHQNNANFNYQLLKVRSTTLEEQ